MVVLFVAPTEVVWQGLTLEKSHIFRTTSDENDFYTEIVELNEIYNFIIWTFSYKSIKMLEKTI